MTEQEKRRRRREMERRMRTRTEGQRNGRRKSGITSFRIYVTTILAGGCLLVSMFQTETAEAVCTKVKTVIAAQISAEEVTEWKELVLAYFKEGGLEIPVFEEQETKEDEKIYRPDTEP